MAYELGNPELDAVVRDLVESASTNANGDLIAEMLTTALKLHRDGAPRGDLKLVNTALKEMRYSMLVFRRHDEPKVTMYGSARLGEGTPNYRLAEEFARAMVARKWGVITGAGPGIMEAGNKGAGPENSYGVNIRLPFEASANAYVLAERTVNFKYFFTRKLGFVKESHAFALFPGGFGTLDETFELLTLIQTGKSDLHPIVMLESEGSGYWQPLIDFASDVLVDKGLISPLDLDLFSFTTDPEAAADEICRFYANYHSQRYVDGRLVLRMTTPPSPELLEELNDEFSDIVVTGRMESISPTSAEVRDSDALDLARITFHFDRRQFGALRRLVDRLNEHADAPTEVHPPAPFTDEQADREW
ncbi:MAG TPA: TIGR00730 family Rossman fold protein [Acidimicrobiia bacterium]|nr:TIGR00730 family Rossman fold protein [Acidimicrobiia bacterium]